MRPAGQSTSRHPQRNHLTVTEPGHDRGEVERAIERLVRAGLEVPQHGLPFGLVEEPDLVVIGDSG
jgi:hypothetical protein